MDAAEFNKRRVGGNFSRNGEIGKSQVVATARRDGVLKNTLQLNTHLRCINLYTVRRIILFTFNVYIPWYIVSLVFLLFTCSCLSFSSSVSKHLKYIFQHASESSKGGVSHKAHAPN